MSRIRKKVFHMFGATGGGAKGFKRAKVTLGAMDGEWVCVGSVDVDAAANRVFKRRVGVPATTLDLADRHQYAAIHGKPPPPGWREATPDDIRRAANGHRPDCIFLSAPCKGFSGLLSEAKSATAKYQAMNGLAERGLFLALTAWADDPVPLILFENVPRLLTRGRAFVDQLVAMMQSFGYATRETVHDCGELGGLGQSRKRCLIVARHVEKVPNFLYEPPKRALRSVGEIIGKIWMPGDEAAGPMHRIPQLQWKTWVRLAFVEAGSDWRSLNKLAVQDGVLRDYLLLPEMHRGAYGVRPWDAASGVVQTNSRPSNGTFSVADPRFGQSPKWNDGQSYGVKRWDETGATVTASSEVGSGAYAIADPRMPDSDFKGMRVVEWAQTAGVVTGGRAPGSSAQSVADPRHLGPPKHSNEFRIAQWDSHAMAVTGAHGTGQAVADPRCEATKHNNCFRVVRFDETAGTVTAGGHPSAGGQSVSDPRGGTEAAALHGKYHVTPWASPARTVIAGNANGAFSVADPRSGMDGDRAAYLTGGHYGVVPWADHAGAVSGAASHDNGRWSVADPRVPGASDKVIARIVSLDGTWHRPFTTLELAALQSLFDPDDPADVAAFTFAFTAESKSDSTFREWIGNAVPPQGIEPVAIEMLRTLMLADAGETFQLSATPVWVRPVIAALTLSQAGPL